MENLRCRQCMINPITIRSFLFMCEKCLKETELVPTSDPQPSIAQSSLHFTVFPSAAGTEADADH